MTMTFIRISDIPLKINVSKSTVYKWIKLGIFMPPIELGPNRKVYLSQEITMYMRGTLQGKCKKQLVAEILEFRSEVSGNL